MRAAKKKPNKVGRPRIELLDDVYASIISMIEIACTQEEICHVLKISADTLDRRLKERGEGNFAELYKKHSAKGKESLRRLQWKACENGSIPMLIWLGKQWLGQKDKPEDMLSEKPDPIHITFSVSKPAPEDVPPEFLVDPEDDAA